MNRTLFPSAFERVSRGYGRQHRHCAGYSVSLQAGVVFMLFLAAGCATLDTCPAPASVPTAQTSASAPVIPDILAAYAVQPEEAVEGPDWGNAAPPEPVPLPENVALDSPGTPSLWPVGDPQAPVISWFGVRRSAGGSGSKFHKGIDIKGLNSTPILAAAGGIVKFSGGMRGYGQLVVVDHGGGFETAYGHLSTRTVQNGQVVNGGDVLGNMGATGNASTVHLHYEVRYQSKPLDPNWFLPAE